LRWEQGWTCGSSARLLGNTRADAQIKTKEQEARRHIADWFTCEFSIVRVDRVGHAVMSNDVLECFSRMLNKDEAKMSALC
jgi:hypothetical protein